MFKFGVAICIPFFMLNFSLAKDLNASNAEKNLSKSAFLLKTLKQMDIPFSGDKMLAAIKASLPKQTVLYDAIRGDLNKDGIEDVVVVTQEHLRINSYLLVMVTMRAPRTINGAK